jgi:hypothetical protein
MLIARHLTCAAISGGLRHDSENTFEHALGVVRSCGYLTTVTLMQRIDFGHVCTHSSLYNTSCSSYYLSRDYAITLHTDIQ